jgi:F0F1-type ATP synthase assembly protein I
MKTVAVVIVALSIGWLLSELAKSHPYLGVSVALIVGALCAPPIKFHFSMEVRDWRDVKQEQK